MGLESDPGFSVIELENFIQIRRLESEETSEDPWLEKLFPIGPGDFSRGTLVRDLIEPGTRFHGYLRQLKLNAEERTAVITAIVALSKLRVEGETFPTSEFLTIWDAQKIIEKDLHRELDGLQDSLSRKILERLFL